MTSSALYAAIVLCAPGQGRSDFPYASVRAIKSGEDVNSALRLPDQAGPFARHKTPHSAFTPWSFSRSEMKRPPYIPGATTGKARYPDDLPESSWTAEFMTTYRQLSTSSSVLRVEVVFYDCPRYVEVARYTSALRRQSLEDVSTRGSWTARKLNGTVSHVGQIGPASFPYGLALLSDGITVCVEFDKLGAPKPWGDSRLDRVPGGPGPPRPATDDVQRGKGDRGSCGNDTDEGARLPCRRI